MPLPIYTNGNSLQQIKSIIGIAAGKGGVGKSTITVQLALTLQNLGYSVGIMDADLYGPSIRKMLPENKAPQQNGNSIEPAMCGGIKMISMAYFRKTQEATIIRAPIANNFIANFIHNVQWGALDYLLIDFPPGTGDIQLTLSQQARLTCALIVTTPQEIALQDVRKSIILFEQVQVPILGIVENMSYYQQSPQLEKVHIFGKGGGGRLATEVGVPMIAQIPLEPSLCHCGDNGKSIFDNDNPNNQQTTELFLKLATNFIAHVETLKLQQAQGLQSFKLQWQNL